MYSRCAYDVLLHLLLMLALRMSYFLTFGTALVSMPSPPLKGLPGAVATVLGCCLHAGDMLLLPTRMSRSEVTAAAVVPGGASTPSVQRAVLDGTGNIMGLVTPVGGLGPSATAVIPVTGGPTAVAGQWPVLVHTPQEGLTEAEEEQERWRLLEMAARHLKAVAQVSSGEAGGTCGELSERGPRGPMTHG